ncbi:acyl-CoA thioesterase [uncultured Sphingomonas sp.]|uniref:acyl-CoA thioesterase n=1 Tax=uncultured Sphingomonas sp. TaxID=158754 RepID=UPI0035CC828A
MVDPIAPTDVARYPASTSFRLLFTDVDSLQHVNNIALARYLAEARATFDAEVLGHDLVTESAKGHAFVIARVTIDYLHEAKHPGTVEVHTGCAGIGRTSFKLAQALIQHDRCVAVALTTLVHRQAGVPSPLPEAFRQRFAERMMRDVSG